MSHCGHCGMKVSPTSDWCEQHAPADFEWWIEDGIKISSDP